MAKDIKTYYEQSYIDNTLRLREVLQTLPSFTKDYFRAVEPTTSAKTRISYAYDIRVFFHFLIENNPIYHDYTTTQFTLQDLERVEPIDIEEYLEYLKVYKADDNQVITNGEKGLARKFSSLRSFYRYFYRHQMIEKNPTIFVDMPKLHDKAIIRLDIDEVALLLDYVENCGKELTGQKKVYYEKTKTFLFHTAASRLLCYFIYQLPTALAKHHITTRVFKRRIQSYQYACTNSE